MPSAAQGRMTNRGYEPALRTRDRGGAGVSACLFRSMAEFSQLLRTEEAAFCHGLFPKSWASHPSGANRLRSGQRRTSIYSSTRELKPSLKGVELEGPSVSPRQGQMALRLQFRPFSKPPPRKNLI
jgi:hypothetical protein